MTRKPTKLTKKKLLAEIRKHMKRIAKERDSLRWIVSDGEEILQSCDDALGELERAVDTLSQYL